MSQLKYKSLVRFSSILGALDHGLKPTQRGSASLTRTLMRPDHNSSVIVADNAQKAGSVKKSHWANQP